MSLFSALDIGSSGLAAQRLRVELLAQNIANAQTTRTPEGGPYRRRHAVFESDPSLTFGAFLQRAGATTWMTPPPVGVRVAEVIVDESAPERRYLPNHPDASPEGYVEFPPFNPVEDMVDLTAGVRSYQANLAAINAIKEMLNRTIEISR